MEGGGKGRKGERERRVYVGRSSDRRIAAAEEEGDEGEWTRLGGRKARRRGTGELCLSCWDPGLAAPGRCGLALPPLCCA